MTTGTAIYSRTWIEGQWLDHCRRPFYRAVYAETNARIQAGANELGTLFSRRVAKQSLPKKEACCRSSAPGSSGRTRPTRLVRDTGLSAASKTPKRETFVKSES